MQIMLRSVAQSWRIAHAAEMHVVGVGIEHVAPFLCQKISLPVTDGAAFRSGQTFKRRTCHGGSQRLSFGSRHSEPVAILVVIELRVLDDVKRAVFEASVEMRNANP